MDEILLSTTTTLSTENPSDHDEVDLKLFDKAMNASEVSDRPGEGDGDANAHSDHYGDESANKARMHDELGLDIKDAKMEGADLSDDLPSKKQKTKKEMEEEEREKMQYVSRN